MNQRAQNIAVGITVIVALLILAGMILVFTGVPQLFARGYEIQMEFRNTGGVQPGDVVHLSGMDIGKITYVRLKEPRDPSKGVILTARINRDIRLPGNTIAHMHSSVISLGGGGAYIALAPDGEPRIDPATGKKIEWLPTDRIVTIEGKDEPAGGLLPTEVTDAMKSLSQLGEEMRPAIRGLTKLIDRINAFVGEEPTPPPAGEAAPSTAPSGQPGERPTPPARQQDMRPTLAKLAKIIDGLDAIVGDPRNQENFARAVENLSQASTMSLQTLESLQAFSEEARKLTGRGDDLMQKLIQDAEKLSNILTSVEKATRSIDQGQGNLGKLIYDTELYNNMIEASKSLTKTLEEFRDLLKQWKATGVGIKLK